MNTEYNKNFFIYPTWPKTVGICLIAAGLIPFFLMIMNLAGRLSFLLLAPGIILIGAGTVFILVSGAKRANESALKEDIDKAMHGMRDDAVSALEIGYNELEFNSAFPPYEMDEFDFSDRDDLLVARGNDGKYRSNYYSATRIFYTSHGLCIYARTFCLTSDYVRNFCKKIKYTDITNAVSEDEKKSFTVNGKSVSVGINTITISVSGGEEIKLTGRFNDSDMDSLVLNINKIAEKIKKEGI